jgi:uncharacterized protein (DUF3820 family)
MTEGSDKSESIFWFGKYKDKDLSEVPRGYLRWMVDNFDPVPLPKDTRGLSLEEVTAMENRMRDFLKTAESVLSERDES